MTTYTTCPWCGTNYAAFQSNCNNCGGPIPPPQQDIEESSPSPEPDIILPPPPPRPISDRYKWRFMLSDGWSIAAGIFVMLGLIFSTVGGSLTFAIVTALIGVPFLLLGLAFLVGGVVVFYWRHDEAVKLVNVLKHGEAVRGQVIDLQENQN
ncbi:MAG: phage holin family protein, partial [Anaerolineales bacterium]|nr:phage holin family protein [Anaerolineales bacterium]